MSLRGTIGPIGGRKPTYRFAKHNGDQLLGELILYIAKRCEADPTFGATKLNKILWWADFLSYARNGEPVTGVEYQKLPAGPAPVRLLPVREALIRAGNAKLVEQRRHLHMQMRLVPLREADTTLFTDTQLAVVNEQIYELWGQTASEISNDSHGKAWESRAMQESIPYEAIFLSDLPISPSDVRRTHELADEHKWERA